jgi:hypothetical protein
MKINGIINELYKSEIFSAEAESIGKRRIH